MKQFSPRQIKQLSYALSFFGAIIIFIVVLIFVFRPKPTCFDNKQNQGEEEVDCGTVCGVICELKTNPIHTTNLRFIDTRKFFVIAATLQNSSINYGAKRFFYEIKLNGTDKKNLLTLSGDSHIYPAQAKKVLMHFIKKNDYPALVWPSIDLTESPLNIFDIEWLDKGHFENPNIQVIERKARLLDKGILEIYGKVRNLSEFHIQQTTLIIYVYDILSNFLGVGKTTIENMGAFENKEFRVFAEPSFLEITEDDLQQARIEFIIDGK